MVYGHNINTIKGLVTNMLVILPLIALYFNSNDIVIREETKEDVEVEEYVN